MEISVPTQIGKRKEGELVCLLSATFFSLQNFLLFTVSTKLVNSNKIRSQNKLLGLNSSEQSRGRS